MGIKKAKLVKQSKEVFLCGTASYAALGISDKDPAAGYGVENVLL